MIADAKNKGHEKVPLAGTQEFLNRGKLCRGVVCVSSNADGLFRVPGMWTKGMHWLPQRLPACCPGWSGMRFEKCLQNWGINE